MKSYDDIVTFHGHSCPGLALGYRVSRRALKELGNRSADEEVVAIVENNSCAVDAVQVMTGCTFGKGVITSYSIHYTKLYEDMERVKKIILQSAPIGVPGAGIVAIYSLDEFMDRNNFV